MHYHHYASWFLNESTFPSSIVSLLSPVPLTSLFPNPLPLFPVLRSRLTLHWSSYLHQPKHQPSNKHTRYTYTAVGIMQYACTYIVGNFIGLHTVENTFEDG